MTSGLGDPLLSIVTATFNDEAGLRRTLSSLATSIDVSSSEVECLVMDGGTKGGLESVAKDFPWAHVYSAPDEGTYDAMNKGLAWCRGKYVWFLNGGDEAVVESWERLREILVSHDSLLLFDYYRVGGRSATYRPARPAASIWHGLPTSHQAILYPGAEARAIRYDATYAMSADYEYTARLIASGLQSRRMGSPIARFYLGGASTSRRRQVTKDAALVQRDVLHLSRARRLASSLRHRAIEVVMMFQTSAPPGGAQDFLRLRRRAYSEKGYWAADRARYPSASWLTQPGLWAIGVYRFGRWTRTAPRVVRPLMHGVYFAAYSVARLVTGIDIPRSVAIGPGLMIHHFGGVILNPQSSLGANCTLRHGVNIGSRVDGGPAPVIGDDVSIGASAHILGGITVGRAARIGAMTLVLSDVPARATAIGVPARVIEFAEFVPRSERRTAQ